MDCTKILGLALLLALIPASAAAVDTLYDARFKQWTEQAEGGDADAQYKLGNAYLRGTEVARDFEAAATWFERAAEQEHVKSLYKLGYLYLEGKGLRRDYGKAYRYLRRAAQQGYSPAQFYLGQLYADGKGVSRDSTKALHWFTQAADDNYVPAKAEVERLKEIVAAEEQERAAREAEAAVKAAENRPKPKPAASTKAKAQPTKVAQIETPPKAKPETPEKAKEPETLDTRSLFLTGNWLNAGGEPSKHMPSELTRCGLEGEAVVCQTPRLKRTNVFARVDYMVEAKFGRFTEDGEFMGTYRTNVLFVLPDDPDNPNPSEEDVPSTGWKQQTIIKCKFEGADKLSCVNDNFKRERFTRGAPLPEGPGQALRAGASNQ